MLKRCYNLNLKRKEKNTKFWMKLTNPKKTKSLHLNSNGSKIERQENYFYNFQ